MTAPRDTLAHQRPAKALHPSDQLRTSCALALIVTLVTSAPAHAQQPSEPPGAAPREETSALVDSSVRGSAPEVFEQLWINRRAALEKFDRANADAMLAAMVEAKQLSGWPNLVTYGLAVAREAIAVSRTGESAQALRLAEAGTKLAPYRPETWAAWAKACLSAGDYFGAIANLTRAAVAIITDPIELRLRLGNLALASVIALLIASLIFGVIALYRHQGQLIFGVLQLLPTGATRLQAALIVTAAAATPLLVGVGPIWTVLIWVALPVAFYDRRERIGACVVIAFLALVPLILPRAAEYLGYPGSRAQDLYLAATDMGARDAAARLLAQSKPTPAEILALGLRERYAGHIEQAQRWIEQAIDKGMEQPSVYTALGNLRFFAGNRAGAIAAYQRATTLDPKHVSALFNISRIYFSQTEHQKAGEAHRQATAVDYDQVEKYDQEAKLHGPMYVAPDEVPRSVFATYNVSVPAVAIATHDVWRELSGRTLAAWYAAVAALIGVLVAVAGIFIEEPVATTTLTAKVTATGKSSVEPLQRIRHEIEAHRHNVRLLRMRRVLAVLVAGTGQLMIGRALAGFGFLVVFVTCIIMLLIGLDILPSPVPLASGPPSLALVVYAGIAVAVYVVSLWDSSREDH